MKIKELKDLLVGRPDSTKITISYRDECQAFTERLTLTGEFIEDKYYNEILLEAK